MRKFPDIGKRSFFSALRDDTRTIADAAGIPQNIAEMVKAGLKVGVKVFACLIAGHELQTHARRLLSEAAGELVVRETEEDQQIQRRAFDRGRAITVGHHFETGRLLGHFEGCAFRREVVPKELQQEIKRRQNAGTWFGPAMEFEEDQEDEHDQAEEAELVDEPVSGVMGDIIGLVHRDARQGTDAG